ncbi:unnamed protein product [Trifolium pratense]|uniref:Uncharacterized protein n=1 Tax=Trifolium pratense TaxID=57577 RepID=A0ACB0IJI9_TRIPR|nr:unnamed protein product [Trifolium pratense]
MAVTLRHLNFPSMAVTLRHLNFPSLSSSNSWFSKDQRNADTKLSNLHCQMLNKGRSSKKRRLLHHALFSNWNSDDNVLTFNKPKRNVKNLLFASSDDGVSVNDESQSQGNETDATENATLVDDVDFCDGLLQSLYDAARVFELEIKEHNSLSRVWFPTVWFEVERNAWEKTLSYQASVYSLLQAASEFSSQSDERDKNVNVYVQKSLLRLSAQLESSIREKLPAKQPKAYDWFWSKQVPAVVASFINKFEGSEKNICGGLSCTSEVSLLMLALSCIAAITKVGPTKLSCSQFFSMSTEITGSLMDMLVGLIPISQAYSFARDAGLCREFLVHFGPRAAACRGTVEQGSQEVIFWVYIAQRQLQKAIDKERIWSRLTTSESIEVLEKDLAIFGFFIALGRSTRSYMLSNGFNTLDDPVEDFIRYLIVGSVLYYPELSSISSYQLYMEVVCEELDWLPFYPGITSTTKQLHMHKSKQEGPPNAEAIPQALDICFDWMQSFIKYSTWLESPSNVKAARYLSIGHRKLLECMEVRILKDKTLEISANKTVERSVVHSSAKVSDSFDEALKSVEEVLLRLENLLQELYASSASSGKEHLKAPYSVLEKIWKLKKEAEFLEASFSAKEDSLQEESVLMDDGAGDQMVQVQKEGNIIKKSLSKLKETGTDVWQGTQLLAVDAAAAMGLLRRILMRDELTDKEKKTLKRTLTDMVSVIPIGFLMLLPVTAVGHAAMLAAIKKYVPAMIPSTYSPERLDILRQLEKMKQMTTCDLGSNEEPNEVN